MDENIDKIMDWNIFLDNKILVKDYILSNSEIFIKGWNAFAKKRSISLKRKIEEFTDHYFYYDGDKERDLISDFNKQILECINKNFADIQVDEKYYKRNKDYNEQDMDAYLDKKVIMNRECYNFGLSFEQLNNGRLGCIKSKYNDLDVFEKDYINSKYRKLYWFEEYCEELQKLILECRKLDPIAIPEILRIYYKKGDEIWVFSNYPDNEKPTIVKFYEFLLLIRNNKIICSPLINERYVKNFKKPVI